MADRDNAEPSAADLAKSAQKDAAAAQKDADAAAKKAGVDEAAAPIGVQSVTVVMPAEADKSSVNNADDAESEQPPVRAGKPDTPIAQTLAAGAGAHDPPDPEVFDSEGRPREISDGS